MSAWKYGVAFPVVFAFTVFLTSLFIFTPLAFNYESRTSLPLLFQLRNLLNAPAMPDNVVVVTPFVVDEPDLPDRVRHFSRKRHAQIVDRLVALGSEIIVVDLYFEVHSEVKADDARLAASLLKFPSVVLVQRSEKERIPVADKAGDISWVDVGYKLRNSVSPFPDSPSLMAPPLIPADVVRVDRVPLFHLLHYNTNDHICFADAAKMDGTGQGGVAENRILVSRLVPTLTFSVLEQHILNAMRSSEPHRNWLLSNFDELSSKRLSCELMSSLRVRFKDTELHSFPAFIDTESQRYLEKWKSVLSQQLNREARDDSVVTMQLNYLGSPRTIRTIPYSDIEKMYEGKMVNRIRNTVVFLGGSFAEAEHQKEDGHVTAFTGGSRLMSGVEIKATAYQNLMSETALQVKDDWITLLILLPCVSLVWIAATRLDMRWFTVVMIVGVLSVLLLSCYAFVVHRVWLSVAWVLTSMALMIMVSVLWRFKGSTQDRDRAIYHLSSFISEPVVRQLDSGRNHVVGHAVCIVTDIRNFTEVGGKMDPGTLHMTNDAYFSHLFDCVSREGVDVVKTYGDSMTAVWMSNDEKTIDCAVRAGIRILESDDGATSDDDTVRMVTHLGLHRGELAIGFVGAGKQKTVELTGSTVYMASRLEQLNKELGTRFLTTACVAREINICQTYPKGKATLKGYEEQVDVVEIGCELDMNQRFELKLPEEDKHLFIAPVD